MNFKKLDDFLEDMPSRGFPSCEIAVSIDGSEVYHRAVGFADAAKTRPASDKDLYWIYSTTKVITCIAAMRLVEEGRLFLDDPVSKYIPEYADVFMESETGERIKPQGEMKIWHLFTMTGGLTYDLPTPALMKVTTIHDDTLAIVRALPVDPIKFEPGTRYRYSLCHDVLGGVIEVVTGMKLSEYFNALFFAPLGLTDIGFRPTDEQRKRFASMYKYEMGTARAVEIPLESELEMLKNFESGGGGLFSSVSDYLKIISAIACLGTAKNGHQILKPETVEKLKINYLCDAARNDFIKHNHYGYGWGLCGRVHMDPVVSLSPSPIGEFGWNGAANAYALMDTDNRLAIFYASHVLGAGYGYDVAHPKIRDLVYEAIKEK